MKKIQLFKFNGNQVRTVLVNDKPYFVGKDVARILGYANTSVAITKNVSAKFKGVTVLETPGGRQRATVISESGLYKLIFKSHADNAEKFSDWVAEEVLPSIRKHGAYMTPKTVEDALINPDTIINLAQQIKTERAGRKIAEAKVAEMKPKALFADSVTTSRTAILVGELAKILKENGIDIGANRLFIWLRENGYLIRRKGADWNMPTQRAMNLGLFKIKETVNNQSDGTTTIYKTPKVTGKGQQYFINKFIK